MRACVPWNRMRTWQGSCQWVISLFPSFHWGFRTKVQCSQRVCNFSVQTGPKCVMILGEDAGTRLAIAGTVPSRSVETCVFLVARDVMLGVRARISSRGGARCRAAGPWGPLRPTRRDRKKCLDPGYWEY